MSNCILSDSLPSYNTLGILYILFNPHNNFMTYMTMTIQNLRSYKNNTILQKLELLIRSQLGIYTYFIM